MSSLFVFIKRLIGRRERRRMKLRNTKRNVFEALVQFPRSNYMVKNENTTSPNTYCRMFGKK